MGKAIGLRSKNPACEGRLRLPGFGAYQITIPIHREGTGRNWRSCLPMFDVTAAASIQGAGSLISQTQVTSIGRQDDGADRLD